MNTHRNIKLANLKTAILKAETAELEAKHAQGLLRPSALFRPTLTHYAETGRPDRWRMTYGEVFGYGLTPEEAARDFDAKWIAKPLKTRVP
jgi:hypothetical protein